MLSHVWVNMNVQYHKAEVCFCGNPRPNTKTSTACHVTYQRKGSGVLPCQELFLFLREHCRTCLAEQQESSRVGWNILIKNTCGIFCGCNESGASLFDSLRTQTVVELYFGLKTQSDMIRTTAILYQQVDIWAHISLFIYYRYIGIELFHWLPFQIHLTHILTHNFYILSQIFENFCVYISILWLPLLSSLIFNCKYPASIDMFFAAILKPNLRP